MKICLIRRKEFVRYEKRRVTRRKEIRLRGTCHECCYAGRMGCWHVDCGSQAYEALAIRGHCH